MGRDKQSAAKLTATNCGFFLCLNHMSNIIEKMIKHQLNIIGNNHLSNTQKTEKSRFLK